MTSPGQGHHLDFCLEVEGRSLGLVAARVTCVLWGPWCKWDGLLGQCWGVHWSGSVLRG